MYRHDGVWSAFALGPDWGKHHRLGLSWKPTVDACGVKISEALEAWERRKRRRRGIGSGWPAGKRQAVPCGRSQVGSLMVRWVRWPSWRGQSGKSLASIEGESLSGRDTTPQISSLRLTGRQSSASYQVKFFKPARSRPLPNARDADCIGSFI